MKTRRYRVKGLLVASLILLLLAGCGTEDEKPTFTLAPTVVQSSGGSSGTSGGSADITATPSPATTGAEATQNPSPQPTPTPTLVPSPTPEPLAARVNGQPILLADFEREVARAGDAATPRQVLDAMIEMALLEQAAIQAGITVSEKELDAIIQADVEAVGGREVFESRLAANGITEQEYRAKTRAEILARQVQLQIPDTLPETAPHVHARHILVDTQAQAQEILEQLQNGADFGTLARSHSQDATTRDRGGDLGFFPRGVLLAPELDEAAFSLEPGQISGVVHSELLGYHIIQVLEREERPISENDRAAIQANQRETVRRWRENLWNEAQIERLIEP